MQLHGNARTTPYIRREMVRRVRERADIIAINGNPLDDVTLFETGVGFVMKSGAVVHQ